MVQTKASAERAYRAQRASTIASDARHDEAMTRVAARGGLTLEQMRALTYKKKDAFIFTYRDGGPHDKDTA